MRPGNGHKVAIIITSAVEMLSRQIASSDSATGLARGVVTTGLQILLPGAGPFATFSPWKSS